MARGKQLFNRLKWSKAATAVLGGSLMALIGGYFSPLVLGLGTNVMEAAVSGTQLPWDTFLWKIIATSITLGSGGTGGIVTPILVVGALAGNCFSYLFGSSDVYSAMGMAALLAGAVNTPISAAVMVVELFGPDIAPYAAICGFTSYLVVGHRSIYPSQLLTSPKSPSISTDMGKPIGQVCNMQLTPRPHTLLGILFKFINPSKDNSTHG